MSRWFVQPGDVVAMDYAMNAAPTAQVDMILYVLHKSNPNPVPYVITRQPADFIINRTKNGFQGDRINETGEVVGVEVGGGVGSLQRGQFYMTFGVSRNGKLIEFARGYVYAGHGLSLGEIVEPGPAGGHGMLRSVLGGNPAAGVLPSDAVPAGALWKLRAYTAVMVADANAGNRGFALLVDDSATTERIWGGNNTNVQAATLTRTWAWFIGTEGTGAAFVDTDTILPAYNLKELMLLAGSRIRLVSTGAFAFTATDDFAAPVLQVEEWVMENA